MLDLTLESAAGAMRRTIRHMAVVIVSAVVRARPWAPTRADALAAAAWDLVAVGGELLTAHTTGLWQAEILTEDGRQGPVDVAELAVIGTGS